MSPKNLEQRHVLLICGKDIFGESLETLLRGLDDVQLIGPLRLDEVITTHIEQEQPDIVLVARQEGEFADISSLTSQLLDGHPGLPVIHCTLSANSVRIYTSRDLPARTSELVQAIRELPIHRD